jgi:hypothetical protein
MTFSAKERCVLPLHTVRIFQCEGLELLTGKLKKTIAIKAICKCVVLLFRDSWRLLQ